MPDRCCFDYAVAWLPTFLQTGVEGAGASMTLEEKRYATRIEHMHSHLKPCAKLQFPKIPLALGGGMWHTISVLPVKGEIAVTHAAVGSHRAATNNF